MPASARSSIPVQCFVLDIHMLAGRQLPGVDAVGIYHTKRCLSANSNLELQEESVSLFPVRVRTEQQTKSRNVIPC